MQVLVDTSVWSLAFRRSAEPADSGGQATLSALKDLIADARAMVIGPIRQEILSGIKSPAQFNRVRDALAAFPDEPLATQDFEKAAEFFNQCKNKGIQGSHIDFLICAVAARRKLPILSLDKDFVHFQKYLPITLFEVG